MSEVFKPLLARLASGAVLSETEAVGFFSACLRGDPTPAQVASALTAMHLRGETVGEIMAGARAMRAAATRLDVPYPTLDVCGTGGDGLHTFNISTAVAFVVAGAGLKVAKHGNRALSSKSGAADVLEVLGVNLTPSPEAQRRALDEASLCFLFATAHHSAMRHVSPIRAELGFRTIFNILGPLSNPAGARRQVVGVFSEAWIEPLATALGRLGSERAWVVHGSGMDEITTTGETQVAEWKDGEVRRFSLLPEDVGLARANPSDLVGGSPVENAEALKAVLSGQTGAYRDIVCLNAGAALLIGGRVETLKAGVQLAGLILDDGHARVALERLIEISHSS